MPRKINLLIFDLDGTLIDSKKDIADSVHWTLRELNLPSVTDELIYSYVGNGVRPLIQRSVGEKAGPKFDKALKIFKDYYRTHLLDHTVPLPGTLEVLDHFQSKRNAVLTNKPQEFTDPILEGLKLTRYFDAVIGSDAGFPKKPDPSAILHLMEILRCPPAETVFIGDSRVDVETGKKAGILTCGFTGGFRTAKEVHQAGADFVISHISDLKSLFV